ncbi:hypothetical protein ILUMI_02565, partial [Ignelater luminosus]
SFYQTKVRHALCFFITTLQLCFYCIPANYIADQASEVANAVYFSNWYSHCFPSLKVLMLVMQNAQNGITIEACGLITYNVQTVVT